MPHLVIAVTPDGQVVLRSNVSADVLRSFGEDLKSVADELEAPPKPGDTTHWLSCLLDPGPVSAPADRHGGGASRAQMAVGGHGSSGLSTVIGNSGHQLKAKLRGKRQDTAGPFACLTWSRMRRTRAYAE